MKVLEDTNPKQKNSLKTNSKSADQHYIWASARHDGNVPKMALCILPQ